jgi:hypothetical protein
MGVALREDKRGPPKSFPGLNTMQERGFKTFHPFMSSPMTTQFCLRTSWTLLISPSHMIKLTPVPSVKMLKPW